jgi:hypothetical protein
MYNKTKHYNATLIFDQSNGESTRDVFDVVPGVVIVVVVVFGVVGGVVVFGVVGGVVVFRVLARRTAAASIAAVTAPLLTATYRLGNN